jgi:hypothetical protein
LTFRMSAMFRLPMRTSFVNAICVSRLPVERAGEYYRRRHCGLRARIPPRMMQTSSMILAHRILSDNMTYAHLHGFAFHVRVTDMAEPASWRTGPLAHRPLGSPRREHEGA